MTSLPSGTRFFIMMNVDIVFLSSDFPHAVHAALNTHQHQNMYKFTTENGAQQIHNYTQFTPVFRKVS